MIIDTFSSLRAEKMKKIKDTIEICFICGIDKQIFDRASTEPDGFKSHVKIDHNMWNYLYFIFLLWEQDKDDDDGMEQYVRRAIDKDEIVWFPVNKAVRLEQIVNPTEVMRNDLKENVKSLNASLSSKFDDFHVDVENMIEQMIQSLKYDPMASFEPLKTSDSVVETNGNGNDNEKYSGFVPLGNHINIILESITDLSTEKIESSNMSVRMIFGSEVKAKLGIWDNQQVMFDNEIFFPLYNIPRDESKTVLLQILKNNVDLLTKSLTSTFIGSIEFPASELYCNEDVIVLSKEVSIKGQENMATITLRCENMPANSFGAPNKQANDYVI